MSTLTFPDVTGPLRIDGPSFYLAMMEDEPTGYEYKEISNAWGILIHFWGFVEPEAALVDEQEEPDGLQGRAAALAAAMPHVASQPPPTPVLSGNLAEDVHEVCGLTWRQIADVFRISERAAAGWRTQGVPGHRVETMEALRAIGATLIGGLGPSGVCKWLIAGQPSRLEQIRDGNVDMVADEAMSYLDTPAT